eukprot:COSAG01_NODE_73221_length_250_cov_14.900662_1_plen_29_part_10
MYRRFFGDGGFDPWGERGDKTKNDTTPAA